MKSKLIIIICAMIFTKNQAFAQNIHFIHNGVIEFEKRANMYAIGKKKINKENESWYGPAYEQYKKSNPQFRVMKSSLSFTKNKSLYQVTSPEETLSNNWIGRDALADLRNIVATNFDTQTSITKKQVYEETYLVKDSVRKINWKITDETREIAGFECRRANALIMDSIYVVAYYTNQIAVSGGPESFTGLPGMILGLALPHENVTWFATKVNEVAVPEKDLLEPTKGKSITNKGLSDLVRQALKNYGPEALSELKIFNL